jgi:hypothetical protein
MVGKTRVSSFTRAGLHRPFLPLPGPLVMRQCRWAGPGSRLVSRLFPFPALARPFSTTPNTLRAGLSFPLPPGRSGPELSATLVRY